MLFIAQTIFRVSIIEFLNRNREKFESHIDVEGGGAHGTQTSRPNMSTRVAWELSPVPETQHVDTCRTGGESLFQSCTFLLCRS